MKDSDEHRSSIGKMSAENQKLHTTIRNLEKDISDLKSEIKSRDDTISDKEKRITDLKRSGIELEKHRCKAKRLFWNLEHLKNSTDTFLSFKFVS
jgi:septal ring factor EnvC (AmiA/AmiB activator)